MIIQKSMRTAFITLVFLLFFFAAAINISCSSLSYASINPAAGCNQIEREALLKFKHGLEDPSNRLASWGGDDSDCCGWYGVVCDNSTSHVTELHLRTQYSENYEFDSWKRAAFGGKINESLQNLKQLNYLDLSNNNFGGIQIPRFLGSMESLRCLNFSRARFGGIIPHQLGNLSNLQYLNLNGGYLIREWMINESPYLIFVESLHWLSTLQSLEYLDLGLVDLVKAIDWLDVLNTLPSLVELHLSGCRLSSVDHPIPHLNFSSLAILDLSRNYLNSVPRWIFGLRSLISLDLAGNGFVGHILVHLQNITSLKELDLSNNEFNSSIPNWLFDFPQLELLRLSNNNLEGEIPCAIGNLTSLTTLDLSGNSIQQIEGGITTTFKNLCNLRSLDLTFNKLSQDINEVIENLPTCASHRLEHLYLSSNQISGQFTEYLGKFKNLVSLNVDDNLISGPIPETIGKLNSLTHLNLAKNKLNGTLPIGFGMLEKLQYIDISGNLLEGEVSEIQFTNLTYLKMFIAPGNHLVLRVSPDWIPPFQQVIELNLQSWHIGPLFPTWLDSLKQLRYFDLSNSKISSTLPLWFLNLSFSSYSELEIDLSHNQMHGIIPYINSSAIHSIDLSSNNFEGPLPHLFSNLILLDLSNNSFSGSISNFLCSEVHEQKDMQILNFGENLLSGKIPDCWNKWKYLEALILSNNYFNGTIPKSIGTLIDLKILDLHNNNVSSEIPLSLQNLNRLTVLDLSENGLGGDISTWIGEHLSQLEILNLRGNKFHGFITKKLCHMNFLRILDLADNNLNGTIPICINNLRAMVIELDHVQWIDGWGFLASGFIMRSSIMRKGAIAEYSITLGFVKSFDLSNNKLVGEIPKEIISLSGLQSLNFSGNLLNGSIPKNIGAMKPMESLDFSQNQLVGEIPQSISNLTFLSYLNLSNNKLSGQIPLGTQMQSFSPSSFIGNNLCGLPLTKNCNVEDGTVGSEKERTTKDDESELVDWFYFYVSIAPGFVVGFWVVVGPLVFNRRWRYFYFEFLNHLLYKIWVWFYVYVVRVLNF